MSLRLPRNWDFSTFRAETAKIGEWHYAFSCVVKGQSLFRVLGISFGQVGRFLCVILCIHWQQHAACH